MSNPPRPANESVITRYMWASIGLQSIVATAIMSVAFLVAREHSRFFGLADSSAQALAIQQTAIFVVFMIQKILRSAFTARSLHYNLWEIGLFSNKWSLYAAGLTVVVAAAAIYILPVGMVPLPADIWPKLLALGLIPAVVEEVVKFVRKKLNPALTRG